MRELTTEEFNSEIYDFDTEEVKVTSPVLIDLWAEWCSPCKITTPILEEIDNERSDIDIYKINVDEENDIADYFGISGIPTFIYISPNSMKSFVGALPKEKFNEIIDNEKVQ